MKIFVTGATGFIGKQFLLKSLSSEFDIVALFRSRNKPTIKSQNLRWIRHNLDSVPISAISGCEALVHLAAHGASDPQSATWDDCFRWNVTSALALWQKALAAGVRRFIICGSCFEYGASAERYEFIPTDAPLEPTGPYHSSKAAATMAALGFAAEKNVELIILRPFHVYGDGESEKRFWTSLKKAAENNEDFPMSTGDQIRDFVPVQYVVEKFHWALRRKDLISGKPLIENIGTGEPRSLLQFAEIEWSRMSANGNLLPGLVPHRKNEVMRYVPFINSGTQAPI
ncbi:MAG: NAD(P)-dependent oxidoreductase [Verrucomicrobiaceae bacterium]|nr:MAG: NAD(P)-dependent oxidoreductase [Verrucomicrobiaceae bacterium]